MPAMRKTLFALLLLFSFLLLGGFVLYRHFPAGWLGNIVARQLSQKSGWKFDVGSIAPFPLGHFSMGPIRISSPQGREAFSLDQVMIDYEVDPLFEKKAVVRSLVIDSPRFILWKEKAKWNLQVLSETFVPPTTSSSSGPFPFVQVDQFEIRRLNATMEPGGGFSFSIPPTNLSARFSTAPEKDFRGELRVAADDEKTKEHIKGAIAFDLSKGNVRVDDLLLDLPPKINANLSFSMEAFKHLFIRSMVLKSSFFGLSSSFSGSIESARPFLSLYEEWKKNPSNGISLFRKNVNANLLGSLSLTLTKVKQLLPQATYSGNFLGSLHLEKVRADQMEIALSAETKNFSAKMGENEVENLTLRIPITKRIYLGSVPREARYVRGNSPWSKSLFTNLRPLSSFNHTIRAKRITSSNYTLRDVDMDAGLDESNLIIDRLSASFLGGSIWGRMTLVPEPDAIRLSLAFEGSDLDMAKLSGGKKIKNAKISADFQADLLANIGEKLTTDRILDELEARFHLTKVGDDTLTQLIAFLDPKGENPSMVQARGLMANPTIASAIRNPRVEASISHGILDADLKLPGVQIVDLDIPIRGLSVKKLLTFESLRSSVEGLIPLLNQARYLEVIGIDDRGNPIFPEVQATERN